jgi:Icc-related predicted phosphoesterase
MKILCTSDIHSNIEAIKRLVRLSDKYDLVLIAGDLFDRRTTYQETKPLLKPFKRLRNIFIVHGNNENKDIIESYKEIFSERYLNFSFLNFSDLIIMGIGGAIPDGDKRHYPNFSKELKKILVNSNIHKIVLSHYPAKGINDEVFGIGIHVGFRTISNFLYKIKPNFLLTGHIHEAIGISNVVYREGNVFVIEKSRDLDGNEFNLETENLVALNAAYVTLKKFVECEVTQRKVKVVTI